MKYFPRVLPYLWPYRGLAAVSVCLIFVGSLTGLLTPWPLLLLVDYVLGQRPLPGILGPMTEGLSQMTLLGLTVGASFVLTVIVHAVGVVNQYVNTKLDQRMALDFRTDLFEHAQRLSLAFHDHRRTGHLIFTINSQGEAVSRLVMVIPPLAQSVITLVGMVWICWRIDWQLTLIALSIAPLLYVSTGYYMKHIHSRLVQVRMMEGEALAIVHEAMTMMRVIVAFGRERLELGRFRRQGDEAVGARVNLTVQQALFSLAVATITGGGTALVLGIGFAKALNGTITIGQMLVLLSYISMVYQPLSTISTTIGSLQEVFVNLQIAFDLLDTEPEVKDAPDAVEISRTAGEIRFQDVNFSYQGRTGTLSGITFDVKPGEVVAIVGSTGAGKTTLVSLIPRFYDVESGSVQLDGRDIRSIRVRSLREQISLVLQEPLLFSGTIASNIRYGRPDATEEDVMAAARAAHAHEFISALPDGYETVLGERGAKLSGGERQRICVARAFVKNAPILLLDEPTSSIDTKTENVILDALDRLIAGRTTFIIAHRLSTIRRADMILVLDSGEIVECGTPEDLLRRDGAYRRLYDAQMGFSEVGLPAEAAGAAEVV
jgi:ATP-binding cassette subfamily B protein/subfamily B ATP-binding cassette protein MsbA